MISADSPDEMKSPLLDDGSLDYDNQMAWPSPAMLELPEEQWPDDRKTLESWAMSRVDVHFDSCWDAAVADWESSPNRSGSVADADPEEALEMVRAGIRMHLDQVETCLKAGGGPKFRMARRWYERPVAGTRRLPTCMDREAPGGA